MRECGKAVRAAASAIVESLESRRLMSALVNIKMVVDGGATDGASSIQVSAGQAVNYRLVARFADIGTVNNTTGLTLNSLSPSPTDGFNSLRFNIQQAATDQIQADFNSGVTLTGGFDAPTASSGGTLAARGATGAEDLNGVKAVRAPGTFVGVDTVNTPADVVLGTGSFTVASLGNGLPSSVFLSYLNPNQVPGGFKINGGTPVLAQAADSDPMLSFAGLTLTSAPNASISGRVFNDKNATGLFDGDDDGISGFRVFLDTNHNELLDTGEVSKPVSGTGTFSFTGLAPGEYRLRQVAQAGWRVAFPALGHYDVTLFSGSTAKSLSFANTQGVLIKGTVWHDSNGDRVRQDIEAPLGNWRVIVDLNKNGIWDGADVSKLTNSRGQYRLSLLNQVGGNATDITEYHVMAKQELGYRQTTNGGSFTTIFLPPGGTTSNKNFGFKRLKT